MRFVDTNVLLYAVSTDPKEQRKARIARSILDTADLVLSVQVLQEFYVQATRASKPNHLTHAQAELLVDSFLRFQIIDITVALLRKALTTMERFQISYWDAAIIEAARLSGCEMVLSEDLNHGQNFAGVKVINPFSTAALT